MKFSAKSQIALAGLISSNDISDLFCLTPNISSLHPTEQQRTVEVPLPKAAALQEAGLES